MNRRTVTAALLATAALTMTWSEPRAQDAYPSRAIKFVVPFAAGSATDTLARVLGEKMSASLGQAIVVDNMPGASGFLAAQNVARAEPDGYTVLITSNTTHAANQSLYKKLPYDPVADFAPVSKLGTITLALVVNPSVPVATRAGADRLREGQSRRDHFRQRLELLADRRRDAEVAGRHRSAERALQEQPAGHHRPARRADLDGLRGHLDHDAAGEGRQGQGAGGIQRRTHAIGSRPSDHARGGCRRLRPDGLVRGIRAGRHARRRWSTS